MDLSIFTTPEAWISLVSLIFLEVVLGVDNLVFIAITTNRLPREKQQIGRRLGLLGALLMRVLLLSVVFHLAQFKSALFIIDVGFYSQGVSVRDIVLFVGGGYLIYKGIVELCDVMRLTELKAEHDHDFKKLKQIALTQAIVTIMAMDLVFSIDSVITAVGLADQIIIMIIAVMVAVVVMIIFIDPISVFINKHPQMKILALCFIVVIGLLLVIESLGVHTGMELIGIPIEKLMIYFAILFSLVLEFIQMAYRKNCKKWKENTNFDD